MSELRDFLNWFDGYAENIDKTPNAKQWSKIKARMAALQSVSVVSSVPVNAADVPASNVTPIRPFKPAPPKPDLSEFPFYIDHDNVAKDRSGNAILPKDVQGTLYDLRGMDGDVATVTWADGSTGVRELNANISAVA